MADGNLFVTNLLRERRQRLVGSIMQAAERELFPSVSEAKQKAFRTKVLEAVGSYHDVALDCMRATVSDGSVQNDPMEILRALHVDFQAALEAGRG